MGNHENCGKSAGETVKMKCIQYEIEKLLNATLPSLASPTRYLLFLLPLASKVNMYFLSDIFHVFDNCHFRANTRNQKRNRTESWIWNSRIPNLTTKSKRIYDYKKNKNNNFCIIYAFNVNRQFKGTTRCCTREREWERQPEHSAWSY